MKLGWTLQIRIQGASYPSGGIPPVFFDNGKEGRSVLAGTDERQDTVPQEIKLAEWRDVLEEELTKPRECSIYPTISC